MGLTPGQDGVQGSLEETRRCRCTYEIIRFFRAGASLLMFPFRLPLPFLDQQEPTQSLHLQPIEREQMGPAQFLDLLKRDSDRVESTTFISPKLGDDHFGYFEVEYRDPVYK